MQNPAYTSDEKQISSLAPSQASQMSSKPAYKASRESKRSHSNRSQNKGSKDSVVSESSKKSIVISVTNDLEQSDNEFADKDIENDDVFEFDEIKGTQVTNNDQTLYDFDFQNVMKAIQENSIAEARRAQDELKEPEIKSEPMKFNLKKSPAPSYTNLTIDPFKRSDIVPQIEQENIVRVKKCRLNKVFLTSVGGLLRVVIILIEIGCLISAIIMKSQIEQSIKTRICTISIKIAYIAILILVLFVSIFIFILSTLNVKGKLASFKWKIMFAFIDILIAVILLILSIFVAIKSSKIAQLKLNDKYPFITTTVLSGISGVLHIAIATLTLISVRKSHQLKSASESKQNFSEFHTIFN